MAIRMVEFGGTDWGSEGVASVDLNDTFAAGYQNFMRFIGQDTTGADVKNTTTEGIICQVLVPANTVTNYLVIQGFSTCVRDDTGTGDLKIRIGTAGTTADTQVGVTVNVGGTVAAGAELRVQGCIFVVAIATTHFNKTQANYVSLTGDNSAAGALDGWEGADSSLMVFGM